MPKDTVASNEGNVESVQELNDMMLRLLEESNRIALKVKNAVKQTVSVRLKIEAAEEGDYKFGIGAIDADLASTQTESDD